MNSQPISAVKQIGAIADPRVSDRRLIPFLTVDCSSNQGFEDAIEVHSASDTPGDVVSTWGWRRFSKKTVYLKLDFKRPGVATAHLEFDVATQGYAVEWIRGVHGVYLQSSAFGSCVSEGLGKPAVLVEVPHNVTFPAWDGIFERSLRSRLARDGVRRSDIPHSIREYKARMRELWFRFSQSP